MGIKLTTGEFINRANNIHDSKYNYDLVDYKNYNTKVKIICPKHGVFEQTPLNHLNKKGCSRCANNLKKTTEQFIEECIGKFGNRYDYSYVNYKHNKIKVQIICPIHGIFEQKPNNHLNGQGCPKCVNTFKKDNDSFVNDSKLIHGDKYDYSRVEYKNNKTKVEIICREHGIFYQRPNIHLKGNGCSKCTKKFKKDDYIFTTESKLIHGNKYDYSEVEYENIKTKVKIICPKHGIFYQRPGEHLKGKGCSRCTTQISKPEIEVQEFVKSLGFEIQTNIRKLIKPYELDIYIPSLKKAIEFNGWYWHYHSDNFEPKKHGKKSKLCKERNIRLLHLRGDLWNSKKEKIKLVIKKFLTI
ncbi:MAG: hypothetical protein LBM02_10000 [Lachnospiraceae bacterium]|nr:hypothetical protein [Lachnospiraceae bacterium]